MLTRNAELRRRAGIPPNDTTSEVTVSDTGLGVKVRFNQFPPSPRKTKAKPNLQIRILEPDSVPEWLGMGPLTPLPDENETSEKMSLDISSSSPLSDISDGASSSSSVSADQSVPPSSPDPTGITRSLSSLSVITESDSGVVSGAQDVPPAPLQASVPVTTIRRVPLARAPANENIMGWQTQLNIELINALTNDSVDSSADFGGHSPLQDRTNIQDVAVRQWRGVVTRAGRINRRIAEIVGEVEMHDEGHIPVPPLDGEDMEMEDVKTEEDDNDDALSTTSSERVRRAHGGRTPTPYPGIWCDDADQEMDDNISATSSELLDEPDRDDRSTFQRTHYFREANAYREDGTPVVDQETGGHLKFFISKRLPPLPETSAPQYGPHGTLLDIDYQAPDRSNVPLYLPWSGDASDGEGGVYRRSTTEPA